MKLSTKAVRPSGEAGRGARALTTPIYETTTFVFENAASVRAYAEGQSHQHLYSRYSNPTVVAVEQTLAALEAAEGALLFGSGQAATTTALLALLQAGDEVVCSAAIYGGTLHLLEDVLARFGLRTRFASLEAFARPDTLFSDATRLVWFESPNNPTLRCVDIGAVAAACRARGVLSAIDNTFASPINQQPVVLGVDLVMHSATKYLNGHADVTAGVLAGSAALVDRIYRTRKMLGTVLDPAAAYALGRGLKTLAVRVAQHNTTALALADWLENDPRVTTVYYPGLASHPDHGLARRQMGGFGGMICLDLGSYDRAAAFFDRLSLINRAASLGGVESLCSLPVLTSHWALSEEALARAGVTPGMARLSVGLEDVDDLIADLDQALGKAEG
jgi:cystathionine beta-lyase/cystathionine gamma-synthase